MAHMAVQTAPAVTKSPGARMGAREVVQERNAYGAEDARWPREVVRATRMKLTKRNPTRVGFLM